MFIYVHAQLPPVCTCVSLKFLANGVNDRLSLFTVVYGGGCFVNFESVISCFTQEMKMLRSLSSMLFTSSKAINILYFLKIFS